MNSAHLAVMAIQGLVHAEVRWCRHARLGLLVARSCGELELEDLEKPRVATTCNPSLGGGWWVVWGVWCVVGGESIVCEEGGMVVWCDGGVDGE